MPAPFKYIGILCDECGENQAKKKGLCTKCYCVFEKKRRVWCPGFFSKQAEKNQRPVNKALRRGYELMKVFGITPEQFEEMLIRQHHVCFICSKPREGRALCVDHCHLTGKIRSLLCHKCNTAIGQLDDSPERAYILAAYLAYWQYAVNDIAPNLILGPLRKRTKKLKEESKEVTDEIDLSVFADFLPDLGSADLQQLSQMVQTAAKLEEAVKGNEKELIRLKTELDSLINDLIPTKMRACGLQEFVTTGGLRIALKKDVFANVPAKSSIEKERDDERRAEMIMRREAALDILEEIAPAIIKRKYEISFDRDADDQALAFEEKLKAMENAPDFTTERSVNPKTLAKFLKERGADGTATTEREAWAFGKHTREVAKISK